MEYMKKKHYGILIGLIIIAAGFGFSRNLLPFVWAESKPVKISGKVKTVSHKEKNIYTKTYQDETDRQLEKWKAEKNYTVRNPLIVMNPYGTNTGSVYFYGISDKEVSAECTISVQGAKDYSYSIKNNSSSGISKKQEFLITGLVPGKKNKVILTFYDNDKHLSYEAYFYVSVSADSEIPAVSNVKTANGAQKLSAGLFAMLGHDKTDNANIYLYDNSGTSRGKIPLNSYRSDRLLFIGGQMAYSYEEDKIALVSRLGKVTKTFSIDGYELHHDFAYDKDNGKILCLVNDKKKETIEDVLIAVDVKTGKVEKLIDFEEYLKEIRKTAKQREGGKNTYGGTELDWLHLNSFDLLEDGSIVLSSREQSTVIKMKNIYKNPSVDYLIHGGSLYEGTGLKKYQLKKNGTFVSQAGQHTITYEKDDSLEDGQYYLYMFNNNFASSSAFPGFDWNLYPGTGAYESGTKSMYYKYLVDEKKGTYKLADSFALPYSSIVSSVQNYHGNITYSSGMDKTYGECDSKGTLIGKFRYDADKYAYRVLKYDFEDYWYKKD